MLYFIYIANLLAIYFAKIGYIYNTHVLYTFPFFD